MHIRTFRAASLQDALEQIRHQMGPEASVLHTRQVRDGWMGWLGRTYVEVTAGMRDRDRLAATPTQRAAVDSRAVQADSTVAATGFSSPTHPHHNGSSQDQVGLPLQLQAYREELLAVGVSPEVTERWLAATVSFAASRGDADSGTYASGTPWLEHLQRSIARELRIGKPICTHPGERRVVALVGPTGVGKTTTVAKLAAGFRIEARRRVGLITIDTFRIAAVQQLKAYAEIMDLPMEVVETPDQMEPALDRLASADLVLIDTAGRSPLCEARIDQLVQLLNRAKPDETHLVLSSTSSASVIESALSGFAPVRPTAAILTKLDESAGTATVLSAIASTDDFPGVPVSYVTNGQQVPDDIETADAQSLLSRLLRAKITASQLEAA